MKLSSSTAFVREVPFFPKLLAASAVFIGTASAQTATSSAADAAQTIVVTVSNPTGSNKSSVFQPAEVHAKLGDLVLFNFTAGNHTATQATFFAPCVPVTVSNGTNGFDSGFKQGGTAINESIQAVPILAENVNTTMWFFDFNTCGAGGVGVINPNDSSTETLDGFRRNAVRLNGTATSSSAGHSSTGSSSASATATSNQSSDALQLVLGGLIALPLLFTALLTL